MRNGSGSGKGKGGDVGDVGVTTVGLLALAFAFAFAALTALAFVRLVPGLLLVTLLLIIPAGFTALPLDSGKLLGMLLLLLALVIVMSAVADVL